MDLNLPVKKVGEAQRVSSHDPDTNLVKVSVVHVKAHKRYLLDATPTKRDANGVESFIMCSGRSVKIEDTPRFNAKRQAQLEAEAAAQIKAKSGRAWDLVQAVLAEHGLALVEEAAVPVAV